MDVLVRNRAPAREGVCIVARCGNMVLLTRFRDETPELWSFPSRGNVRSSYRHAARSSLVHLTSLDLDRSRFARLQWDYVDLGRGNMAAVVGIDLTSSEMAHMPPASASGKLLLRMFPISEIGTTINLRPQDAAVIKSLRLR